MLYSKINVICVWVNSFTRGFFLFSWSNERYCPYQNPDCLEATGTCCGTAWACLRLSW